MSVDVTTLEAPVILIADERTGTATYARPVTSTRGDSRLSCFLKGRMALMTELHIRGATYSLSRQSCIVLLGYRSGRAAGY